MINVLFDLVLTETVKKGVKCSHRIKTRLTVGSMVSLGVTFSLPAASCG